MSVRRAFFLASYTSSDSHTRTLLFPLSGGEPLLLERVSRDDTGESTFSLLGGDFSEVFVELESSSISIFSSFILSSLSFVFSAAWASCWRLDSKPGGEAGGENLSGDSGRTSGGCFGGDRGDREELSSMIASSLIGLNDGERSGSGLAGFSHSSSGAKSSLAPGSLSEQSSALLVCNGLAQLRFSSRFTSIASSASSFFSSPFSIGWTVLRGSSTVWHPGGERAGRDWGRGCDGCRGGGGERGSAFGATLVTSGDSGSGGKLLGEKGESGEGEGERRG